MKKVLRKPLRIPSADTWILMSGWLLLSLLLFAEHLNYVTVGVVTRILLLTLIGLVCYMGGLLRIQRTKDLHFMRRLLFTLFCLYLYALLSLTLLDATLRRGDQSIYETVDNVRRLYLSRFFNPIPFRSIYHVYIRGFVKGYVNLYYTVINLVGNIFVLMPLAVFLPYFFPKQRRWYWFLLTVFGVAVMIEVLQFLFMVGSCDVDDLILNTLGALLAFGFLKIPFLSRLITKATLSTAKKMPEKNA